MDSTDLIDWSATECSDISLWTESWSWIPPSQSIVQNYLLRSFHILTLLFCHRDMDLVFYLENRGKTSLLQSCAFGHFEHLSTNGFQPLCPHATAWIPLTRTRARAVLQGQHFPAEGTLSAMTKPLLHSLLLSEVYPDVSLYIINFLSYSVSQLQDFYSMTHLAPCQKGFVFPSLFCFALICFVSL